MEVKNENTTPKTIPNDVDKEQKGINVPNLRFNQFHDSYWIKTSLKDVAKKINAKNKNKFCKNVISNSAQHGLIRQIDYFDKEIAQNESIENYTIINKGDFVYNPRKSIEAPYGPVNIYNFDETGIVSPLYLCFSIQNINKKFLHYYFKSKAWHRFVYLYGDSGARHDRVSIKDEVFFSQQLSIPTSSDEIEKITDLLFQVEQRINTQSKIIEDLELYKKKINDMFFNSIPKHEIKLSEIILKGKAGGTPSSTNREYYNGGIPFLSIADMTEQGKYVYKTEKELSEKGLKNSSAWLVPENCLIMSMYASVGFVSINKIPLTTSQAMFSMIIKDDFLLEYIYYYLNYFKHNKIHRLLETGTQSNINADMVKNIKIPFYGEVKNNQIVNTLTVIDKKIQKEKDMLELYKKQKAYLLQNMFI